MYKICSGLPLSIHENFKFFDNYAFACRYICNEKVCLSIGISTMPQNSFWKKILFWFRTECISSYFALKSLKIILNGFTKWISKQVESCDWIIVKWMCYFKIRVTFVLQVFRFPFFCGSRISGSNTQSYSVTSSNYMRSKQKPFETFSPKT